MVSLWDLLTLICFVMPIGGALASAQFFKAGLGGQVLAVTIGIVLGVSCALMMRIVTKTITAKLQRRPDWEHSASLQKWFFRGLYFAAMIWIVVAGFLGGWVSLAVLRFAF
jgi:hypothetical protein